MNDAEFLRWIHQRLEHQHGENPNYDYMQRLDGIVKSLEYGDKKFKFYRIKHKPTGLFFVPSRSVRSQLTDIGWSVKSNLSTKGKIYHHKPQLTLIISSHVPVQGKYLTDDNNRFSTKESDWEIIGYE